MKKTIISLAIVAASFSALAMDATVSASRNLGVDANEGSISLGNQFGLVRGEATLGRISNQGFKANVVGASVTYPFVTYKDVTLSGKVGASYISVAGSAPNGYALSGGVEAAYPLTKNVGLVTSLERVEAQSRISQFTGNKFSVGLRTSF